MAAEQAEARDRAAAIAAVARPPRVNVDRHVPVRRSPLTVPGGVGAQPPSLAGAGKGQAQRRSPRPGSTGVQSKGHRSSTATAASQPISLGSDSEDEGAQPVDIFEVQEQSRLQRLARQHVLDEQERMDKEEADYHNVSIDDIEWRLRQSFVYKFDDRKCSDIRFVSALAPQQPPDAQQGVGGQPTSARAAVS